MFCPSCQKNFGPVHSRCPECNSWLKVSPPETAARPAMASAKTATPAMADEVDWAAPAAVSSSHGSDEAGWGGSPSGWGASSSPSAWGNDYDTPTAASGPAWGGAPKVKTPENAGGWLGDESSGGSLWEPNGEPVTQGKNWGGAPAVATPTGGGWLGDQPTDDISWSDQGSAPLSSMVDEAISETEESFDDESWVDDDLVEEAEEYDVSSLEESHQTSAVKGLVAALIVLLLGSGFFLLRPAAAPAEASSEEVAADSLGVGRSMFKDAQLSLEGGLPEVAASQAVAAVGHLKEGGAPPEEIHQARELAAGAYVEAQEYEQALEQYEVLKSQDPKTFGPRYESVLTDFHKAERILAQGALQDATAALKNDDTNVAISSAQMALKKFEEHHGSKAQIGKAHGVLGQAYLEGRNLASAGEHLAKAVSMVPGAGFESDLYRVREALQPRAKKPVRTVVAPPVKSSPKYPTRSGPVTVRPRASKPAPQAAAPAPAAQARPKPQAAPVRTAKKPQSGGKKKWLGDQGVLNGY